MTRIWLVSGLLLSVAVTGCGGAGTAPADDGSGGPSGPSAEATRLVLEPCLVEALQAMLEHVELYIQIVDGFGSLEDVAIETGTETAEPDFRAGWARAPGMPPMPVQVGGFSTEDAAGEPAAPFTDMQLDPLRMNGIEELKPLLDTLDAVVFVMTSRNLMEPGTEGRTHTLYASGTPGPLAAAYRVDVGDCSLDISLSDVPDNNFVGLYPTALFQVELVNGSDTVAGSVDATGDQTAAGTFTHNGGPERRFRIDLATGTVMISP